jgi:hypothetical protein
MTIKTQGGKVVTKDGKVSCECCEVCGCLQLPSNSILIPGDPDFSKKLRGDPGVTAFTQVYLSYDFTSGKNGCDPQPCVKSDSWSFTAEWMSDVACDQYNIKKFADIPKRFPFDLTGCGSIIQFGPNSETNLGCVLDINNCLNIYVWDGIYGPGFGFLNTDCNIGAPENTGEASITINGVSMPTQFFEGYTFEWQDGFYITGNITVVFS